MLTLGLSLTACSDGCWWTDPGSPEPGPVMRLGQAYPSEGGEFDVTLEAPDAPWPPNGEPFALDVIVVPRGDVEVTDVRVGVPEFEDGDLVAQEVPGVTSVEPNTRWRLDSIVLDAPGVWEIPLTIDTLGDGDRLGLRVQCDCE